MSLEKYPQHYFEHYLVCTDYEMTDNGFRDLAEKYIHIEGKDVFCELIGEIDQVELNDDWDD